MTYRPQGYLKGSFYFMKDYFPTLKELSLVHKYPDETLCFQIITEHLYGRMENIFCPRCGTKKFYQNYTRPKTISCSCGYQFWPLSRTIFCKSTTPLVDWFLAIRLIVFSDGKIPAMEIQRKLNVTYKTAWRIKKSICDYLLLDSSAYSYNFINSAK